LRRYGPLAIEQLIPLGVQLCSALHYMGSQRMLHLDVKPQNIIMSGPPRLIDLSIARTFDQGRTLEFPVGTDAYMAPGQCDPVARGGVGPEADVWGIGAILYEAASGRRPFPEPSENSSEFPQVYEETPPLSNDVPAPLSEIILSCLANCVEDRPTAAEVAAELEGLMAALPRHPVLSRLKPKLR
jgi:serine/threonine protein kinase